MYSYPVSRYLPIWNKLKTENKVSVAVPQPLHKRVIKAVIKRKDEDLAFKFLISEACAGRKAYLSYTTQENVIHFKLTFFTNGIGDL